MRGRTTRVAAVFLVIISLRLIAQTAELKPATAQAFDRYAQAAEQKMNAELSSGKFLWTDSQPASNSANTQLRSGDVLIRSVTGKPVHVPDGLIHHWIGIAFLPEANLQQVLSVVQDYDHLPDYYRPEVVQSRLLSHDGDHFNIFMRLRKKKIVTAVLDSDYDVRFYRPDLTHAYSVSHSTRVAEVDNPGEPGERVRPTGDDHGFLWRMNSYWRFLQANDGVYVQCEAISLTRDIPAGLGWLIGPFITQIPEESLKFTLEATRTAVQRKITHPSGATHAETQSSR